MTLITNLTPGNKEYRLLRLIPLFDIHAVAPVELKKHPHAFGIVTPRRTYYVTADSASEVQSWCRKIEAAKAEYAARATRLSLDTPTGTEEYPTPVAGTTPIPSPRHAVDATMMMTQQQAEVLTPSDHNGGGSGPTAATAAAAAAVYPRGIAIPETSAPPTNGPYAPASYATTASSSFNGGGGGSAHPSATILGTSHASASTSSSSLGGSRAPPNSLVTPAPFPSSSSPSTASPTSSSATSSYDPYYHQQRTGLGLHSPTGLDARLEQLDLDGTGAFGMRVGYGFGTATATETDTTSSSLQRATSRRSETSPAGRSASSSSGVVKEGGAAAAAGPSMRDRSASTATGSSSLAVPPPPSAGGAIGGGGGGGGFVSSSDDEEAYEPGSEYPTFSPSGLVAPTTLGGPPTHYHQQQQQQQHPLSSPPQQHQHQQQQAQSGSGSSGFADPNKVILSGYLMKQGKRKTWRKRWFVLTSGMLMYSRSHMVRCALETTLGIVRSVRLVD